MLGKFSLTLLVLIFTINIVTIAVIYQKNTQLSQQLTKIQNTPHPELTEIKEQLAQIKKSQVATNPVLGDSTASTGLSELLSNPVQIATSSVTISNSKFSVIDVYQQPIASSKIVGQLNYGNYYPYTTKTSNWYQVSLPAGVYGWVPANLVQEP